MAFDDMPPNALAIIDQQPSIIGMSAVHQIASLLKADQSDEAVARVVSAIGALAAGEIDQKQAVKVASPPRTPREASPIRRIQAGKKRYCEIRRADKVLRVDFQSAEEAQAVEAALIEILENRAACTREPKS